MLLLAVFVSGLLAYSASHLKVAPNDVSLIARGTPVRLEATVLDVRKRASGGASAIVAPTNLRRQVPGTPRQVTGRLWVSLPEHATAPTRGDLVELAGELGSPPGRRNPGAFDFAAYLRNRRIHATVRAEHARILRYGHGFGRAASRIERILRARLSGEPATLLTGLLLGRSSELPDETLDAFRRSGAVHVLAVSGLHVGFIGLIIYALLRSARAPKKMARLLVLPALTLFACLVGGKPSVVRAVVMAASVIGASILERRTHVVNALGVAALVLLMKRPGAIFDLGFQLSFGATLGIVTFLQPLRSRAGALFGWAGPLKQRLADSVSLSVAAQLGVAPLLIANFGELSIVGPLANLAVVPLAAWSVTSGLATVVADLTLPSAAGAAFAASSWLGLKALAAVTLALGSARFATVSIAARHAVPCLAIVAGGALALAGGHRRAIGLTAVVVAFIVSAMLTTLGPGRSYPRITFFDVRQGDAALLEIPGGCRVLVDAGSGGRLYERFDAGRDVILPYLRREGIRKIDLLIVTHSHDDHYGGASSVLGGIPVGTLVISRGCAGDPRQASALSVEGASPRFVPAQRGDTLVAGGGPAFLVRWPAKGMALPRWGPNNLSIVFLAELNGWRLLFTGDIEAKAESSLVRSGDRLDCDILKVAHHGSSTSSRAAFLRLSSPRAAVVSVGAGNRYGHPYAEVMDRLGNAGALVHRTDLDGAVQVALRPGAATLSTVATRRRAVLTRDRPSRSSSARGR